MLESVSGPEGNSPLDMRYVIAAAALAALFASCGPKAISGTSAPSDDDCRITLATAIGLELARRGDAENGECLSVVQSYSRPRVVDLNKRVQRCVSSIQGWDFPRSREELADLRRLQSDVRRAYHSRCVPGSHGDR
jgi:hypothetical protein